MDYIFNIGYIFDHRSRERNLVRGEKGFNKKFILFKDQLGERFERKRT